MMQVIVWALTQCFLKLHSHLAQQYWSGYDLLGALIPYIVAGVFSYLAIWESEKWGKPIFRVLTAVVLVVFAISLGYVSISISSSQAAALRHADGQYNILLAYSIVTNTNVESLVPQIGEMKQELKRLESTPQSPATHVAIQRISTQVTTLSDTVQQIRDAFRSAAPLAPIRPQPVPQGPQTPSQSPTSQPAPPPNARCQVRVYVNQSPQKGDFGGVKIGRTGQLPFGYQCEGQIGSAGDFQIVVDGEAFSTDPRQFPSAIAGDMSHHFVVNFKPSHPGQFTGKLTVLSHDPLRTDFENPLTLTGIGTQ
jgi:hypothetical protein